MVASECHICLQLFKHFNLHGSEDSYQQSRMLPSLHILDENTNHILVKQSITHFGKKANLFIRFF